MWRQPQILMSTIGSELEHFMSQVSSIRWWLEYAAATGSHKPLILRIYPQLSIITNKDFQPVSLLPLMDVYSRRIWTSNIYIVTSSTEFTSSAKFTSIYLLCVIRLYQKKKCYLFLTESVWLWKILTKFSLLGIISVPLFENRCV